MVTLARAGGGSGSPVLATASWDRTIRYWDPRSRPGGEVARLECGERVWAMGAQPAIPPRRTDAEVTCPDWIYANRPLVENLWARLKEWRAVATRYEKTERSFHGVLCLAATAD